MEIKKCPFCGSNAFIEEPEDSMYPLRVMCMDDKCSGCGAVLYVSDQGGPIDPCKPELHWRGEVTKMETPFYKELLFAARNVTDWDWPEILHTEESGDWSDDLKKLEEVVLKINECLKYQIIERYSDNGELSHYCVINKRTGEEMNTFCPNCGCGVEVNEDGCCRHCGATSVGEAIDQLFNDLADQLPSELPPPEKQDQ